MNLKEISHELQFWAGFVKTERFLDGWVADVKTPELHTITYDFIKAVTSKQSKVLDLGSGVVSILNGIIPKENLLACDPLGELYECIFDYKKYGISPPIPLQGEEITFVDQFDIVHMSNAIDHSDAPHKIFRNMAVACKPGGFVILQGFEYEGRNQNYQGMHQIDIWHEEEALMCKHRNETNVAPFESKDMETLKLYAFPNHFQGKTWYIYVAQKL